MRKLFASLLGVAIIMAFVAMTRPVTASPIQAQADSTATARLSGAEEVPTPGDTDGTGSATVRFNSGSGEVCWDIRVANITLPGVGAHIHEGAKGVTGPIVVPFSPPDENGTASGCTTPDAALVTRIMQSPENFYVNVHTSDFPAGAVRGQLIMDAGASPPVSPALPNTGAKSGSLLALAGCALVAVALGLSLYLRTRPKAQPR